MTNFIRAPVSLTTRIQHHLARGRLIPPLLEKLGDPSIEVIYDRVLAISASATWRVYRRCLSDLPLITSHVLILQDDITPCPDFLEAARRAISYNPTVPISFFSTRGVTLKARDQNKAWTTIRNPLMAQAWVWPREMIPSLIYWIEAHINQDQTPHLTDDAMICMFMLAHNELMWCTAPSLVEHTGYGDSLLRNPASVGGITRTAKWLIPDDQSALDIDWERGLYDPVRDTAGSMAKWMKWLRPAVASGDI